MEIIETGSFEIVNITDNLITKIAEAARTCYKSQDKATPETNAKLVKNIIKRGHTAMLESGNITVRFENVSRGFTHEMVRHRLCSFAQESTRYVNYRNGGIGFIPAPGMNPEQTDLMLSCAENCEKTYNALIESGMKPQDARQILPIGVRTEIVVGANIREWREIFKLRCAPDAHWEIRGLMCRLLTVLQDIPVVFDDIEGGQNV